MIPVSGKSPSPSIPSATYPTTNAELVQMLRTDPASAAPLLYRRYERSIRWTVRRMLGSDPEQQDLVQQIFYQVLSSGFDLREPHKLSAWVRSVTVCAVYEELRTRRARRHLEQSVVTRLTGDFARDVESRDLLMRAAAMIQSLPLIEREAFLLRVMDGRRCREIAALTGCSTATVKRRLARANRRMTAMLSRNTELMKLAGRARGRRGTICLTRPSVFPVPGAPN